MNAPTQRAVHPALQLDERGPRLVGGRCAGCDRAHFPLGPRCPWCGGASVTESALPLRGELRWWTAVTAAPPGYEGPVPYGFGIVELAGEVHIVSRLTESDPTKLRNGQPVELTTDVVARDDDGELVAWTFRPVEP